MPLNYRKRFGADGEDRARRFLEQLGFHHLASNYRTRWGELDLVMRDGQTIVFVEVKRRSNANYGDGAEAISEGKRRHIVRSALSYMQDLECAEAGMRFDVVVLDADGFHHYPAALMADASDGYY